MEIEEEEEEEEEAIVGKEAYQEVHLGRQDFEEKDKVLCASMHGHTLECREEVQQQLNAVVQLCGECEIDQASNQQRKQ